MNGARAVLLVATINSPNRSRTNTIGASQSFFRTRKNSQNSRRMPILPIFNVSGRFCFNRFKITKKKIL